jgi:transposase
MAYREIAMWEVLEVLRRVARGEGRRSIARATGHGRATVDRYAQTALGLGWVPGDRAPDEVLAREVVEQLRPGAKGRPAGSAQAKLALHQGRIRAWLSPGDGSRGLQLSKVHELLLREGIEVSYPSLHRYATRHCGFGASPHITVRMAESQPGEVAEVDFGRLGLIFDPETRKNRVHHALIVTLRYSRHQYVHICPTQKLDDVIEGLEAAWEAFGGVPARVVVDNMKTAVTQASRYDPIFQRIFGEYADHRGFTIDAALPRHPTGKPTVERSVQYVRERFFRGESFIDRDHAQREADRWCEEVAGQRIHGTTRLRPFEVFLETEKAALRPFDGPAFDTPSWAECKVHPDHHIQFEKGLYSVPTRYVGQQVTVRGDSKLVRVYAKGELIKTHARIEAGHRSTDYDDYPSELAPYARRDPDYMIREGRRTGLHIGRFMGQLLAGDCPWAKLRQAQKLLRLANKYGADRVNAACRRALAFDLTNVKRVEDMVKNGIDRVPANSSDPRQGELIELTPRFARPAHSFNHHTKTQNQERPDHGDPDITEDRSEEASPLGALADATRPGGVCEEDEA